mmetsp:Transcript_11705/g.32280  ORF Transcript_11705/g.32280 Transcript_11705/m.32280 type:complete len:127 (+) Transcript_11705:340-720(+)
MNQPRSRQDTMHSNSTRGVWHMETQDGSRPSIHRTIPTSAQSSALGRNTILFSSHDLLLDAVALQTCQVSPTIHESTPTSSQGFHASGKDADGKARSNRRMVVLESDVNTTLPLCLFGQALHTHGR